MTNVKFGLKYLYPASINDLKKEVKFNQVVCFLPEMKPQTRLYRVHPLPAVLAIRNNINRWFFSRYLTTRYRDPWIKSYFILHKI